MSSNNNSWEIIQMSNRRLQAQQRRFLRRRTTTTPQQASNLQRYYRLLIMGAHRPSIMVPVLRRRTGSHCLNNNRILSVIPQGGLSSGHGGSQQASRRLPHQFVIALTIRTFLSRVSQNDPEAMSTYGQIRAACLPPPPAQYRPAPPRPLPVNNAVVVDERVRSQEPAPSEEFATDDDNGVTQPYINQPDNPMKNDVVEYEAPDSTPKL